jgi:acyl-CoA thioesterase-2
MAQALIAAYNTVNPEFQIHHLTSQFLHPSHKKPPLSFEVTRTNEGKNNATRTISIIQEGRGIVMIVMSFMRRPRLDNQSPNYQPHFPKNIPEPDEDIDDMKFAGAGMIQAQTLGRTFGR